MFTKILAEKYLSNTLEAWIWFVGIILVGWLIKKLLSNILSRIVFRLIKQKNNSISVADFIKLIQPPLEFIISVGSFYLAVDELNIPAKWKIIPLGKIRVSVLIDNLLDTLFIIAITWIIIQLIKFFSSVFYEKFSKSESNIDEHLVYFFRDIIITFVIFIAFFTELGIVFKQDVVSLITGLGIGGIALALAARETLENLFASFTIFTDRPFVVGDEVQMGTDAGKIEKVGFRSTRIRSFDGSLIIVPNRLIISQVLNNTTQRKERRHKFFIKVKLDTPLTKISKVVDEIQTLINEFPNTNKKEGKVKFESVGEYSINIVVVFFVETADYWTSMEAREEINYKIGEILQKHSVEIATPPLIVK